MTILDVLNYLEQEGSERDALIAITEKARSYVDGSGNPILDDWSPGTPQMVLLQAIAALTSGAVYYTYNIPRVIERYLVEEIFAATPLEGRAAVATVVVELNAPAGAGGYTIPAQTTFRTGSIEWRLVEPITIPQGAIGTEVAYGRYLYAGIARATTVGSGGNIPPNTEMTLVTPLSAVRRAFTPSGGEGGVDPEGYEAMLERVFRRPLDDNQLKLVTIADFHAYLTSRLGAGTRVHVWTPPPTPGRVSISVLLPTGQPVQANNPILSELNQRSPLAPVQIIPANIVPVDVAGTVEYDPAYIGYDALRVAIESRLSQLLHPSTWPGWGMANNALTRSRLIAEIHGITGVIGVNLTSPANDIVFPSPASAPILGNLSITLQSVG